MPWKVPLVSRDHMETGFNSGLSLILGILPEANNFSAFTSTYEPIE